MWGLNELSKPKHLVKFLHGLFYLIVKFKFHWIMNNRSFTLPLGRMTHTENDNKIKIVSDGTWSSNMLLPIAEIIHASLVQASTGMVFWNTCSDTTPTPSDQISWILLILSLSWRYTNKFITPHITTFLKYFLSILRNIKYNGHMSQGFFKSCHWAEDIQTN